MKKDDKKPQGLGPTQRQLRVGEQLRHVIVATLQRGHFHDAYLMENASMVTVSEVKVSPDMKHATAYTVRLGGGDTTEMLASLNANFDVFQRDIGHEIRMKFTPKVKFVEDNSFENATKIDSILHNLPKAAQEDISE
ncbi:MAG: ribosome-binding factor A [Alphaproteobacteria bacterium RIFCSPHIGHO2_02_FULL_46_13]|nr:MAG: ribosome-binding factor A [Alphaproteobacteria bacterium RIFCSPHIGHO2_02_FULL_46_13]